MTSTSKPACPPRFVYAAPFSSPATPSPLPPSRTSPAISSAPNSGRASSNDVPTTSRAPWPACAVASTSFTPRAASPWPSASSPPSRPPSNASTSTPDLRQLVTHTHGLVLISGPTGSGKSSTLAALIQEINLSEPRHILTIESPIEYSFRPRRAFLRQREVGRDTPSFEQALLDALREDPDVLMVGEMREPETMRLTLNAAETGHLVLATVHSGTCAEALQRVVLAFPSEIQNNICAQLAECLVAVVCQRLRFRPDLNIRVPECEVLRPTVPVKAFIRNRDFFKIPQVLEMGGEHGMWTFERYQAWLARRTDWHLPNPKDETPDDEPARAPDPANPKARPLPPTPAGTRPAATSSWTGRSTGGPIEIEPVEGGLDAVLKKLS
ncbi:MAG: ATPase, T2SS/T4P/T4SS family [Verrucomicrobia bacterium]|nr:ATPase, T2SS/T4P/T4SS family [Verrucomicrobiota bacterium]